MASEPDGTDATREGDVRDDQDPDADPEMQRRAVRPFGSTDPDGTDAHGDDPDADPDMKRGGDTSPDR